LSKGCNVNEVAIIHVHERYEPLPTIPNESIRWIMQEHKKEGERILSEALKFIKGKNIKARTILKEGHPADTIVSIAHEERFDMIVIGSRGLGGLKKLFLGSVSNAVIQEAVNCSVLVVK